MRIGNYVLYFGFCWVNVYHVYDEKKGLRAMDLICSFGR